MPALPSRLVELIRRDLGARRVDLVDAEAPDAALLPEEALRVVLPKGFLLVVELADPDADREAPIPYVARSFAVIYVIVLVFDAPFDEIRAERALQARLDTIERLVLALPPIEPTPIAGAKAVRKRR